MGFATAGVERVEISDAGLDMSNGLPIRFQDSSGAPFVALKSPSSVSSNVTFTLPGADGSAGEFLKTDGSGNLSFSIVQGVPSGAVFCIAVASVPSGYLECNGAAVSRTTYAALFAVIGTQYGSTNSTNFKVPDLRGEFVRGFDNGRGVDSGRSVASSQSAQNQSHNHSASATSTAGAHSHSLNYQRKHVEDTGTAAITDIRREGGDGDGGSQTFTNDTTSGFMNNATVSVSTSVSIGNQGSEARPRNIAMMYVIKV